MQQDTPISPGQPYGSPNSTHPSITPSSFRNDLTRDDLQPPNQQVGEGNLHHEDKSLSQSTGRDCGEMCDQDPRNGCDNTDNSLENPALPPYTALFIYQERDGAFQGDHDSPSRSDPSPIDAGQYKGTSHIPGKIEDSIHVETAVAEDRSVSTCEHSVEILSDDFTGDNPCSEKLKSNPTKEGRTKRKTQSQREATSLDPSLPLDSPVSERESKTLEFVSQGECRPAPNDVLPVAGTNAAPSENVPEDRSKCSSLFRSVVDDTERDGCTENMDSAFSQHSKNEQKFLEKNHITTICNFSSTEYGVSGKECGIVEQNICQSPLANSSPVSPSGPSGLPKPTDTKSKPPLSPWKAKSKRRMYKLLAVSAVYCIAIAIITGHRAYTGKGSWASTRTSSKPHEGPAWGAGEYGGSSVGGEDHDSKSGLLRGRRDAESDTKNVTKKVCTTSHSLPEDFLEEEFADNGGWIIHLAIALYTFAAVAAVCDIYFVPSLEHICEDLGLQSDVAGATFMAAGSSAPEFCTSVIGVFFAKSDVGLGAIVGSSIFNLLAIIGACAIFAGMPVQLSWYPLTRDTIFYTGSVLEMFLFMSDEKIEWYEAMIMVITYCFYILWMIFNVKIESWSMRKMNKFRPKEHLVTRKSSSAKLLNLNQRRFSRISGKDVDANHFTKSGHRELEKMGITDEQAVEEVHRLEGASEVISESPASRHHQQEEAPGATSHDSSKIASVAFKARDPMEGSTPVDPRPVLEEVEEEVFYFEKPDEDAVDELAIGGADTEEEASGKKVTEYENPLEWPEGRFAQCYYIFVLPLTLLHAFTIPDSRIQGGWQAKSYLLSFTLSVGYISAYSYLMVWMISLAGYVWEIPDTVTGLTILAAGTSVPDCLASIFVARDGYGDMAISNAIGSNIFDILLCLGIPWLIDSVQKGTHGTAINSDGIIYAVFTLLVTIVYLWVSMKIVNWVLTPKYGYFTLTVYLVTITLCLLIELNVFWELNDPSC